MNRRSTQNGRLVLEKGTLDDADLGLHHREYERLVGELEAARDASVLPDKPTAKEGLNDLLLRVRRSYGEPA